MDHKTRLAIAERTKDRLIEKYGERLLGVAICGSVAKKQDGEFSDIDIVAVLVDGEEPGYSFLLTEGIPLQVILDTESNWKKDASRISKNWAIDADEFHNRLVLYDRNGVFGIIDGSLKEPDAVNVEKGVRELMVELCEERGKLLNAMARKDLYNMNMSLLSMAQKAALIVGLVNRRYHPSARVMFPLSKTFEKLPERYPELIDACHRIRGESREEAARAALALFESCREFVEAIGIEWQDGVGRNLLEQATRPR